MENNHLSFKRIDGSGPAHWLHKTKPVWVVHYGETFARATFYQAYRAVENVPAGRHPWSVDNRRVGSDRGFRTIEEAMLAAEAA